MAGGNLVDFKNVDLMSLIHEQDADLGVDWRGFSHKKNGKSVDDDFDNWPKKAEAPQYEIDGETGEKLLQPRKREEQPQQQQRQPNTVSSVAPSNNLQVAAHRQQQRTSFGDGYLDELNDILKTPDNMQQKNFSFEASLGNNAVQGNNGIPNGNFVEPMGTDNGIPEYDEDIWQDIASLTDFSDMSFTTETNDQQQQPEPAMMQQQQNINANGYATLQQQPATFFGMQQHSMYNASPMFAQYDPYGTQQQQQSMDCSPPPMIDNQQKVVNNNNGFQQNLTSPPGCQPFNCQPQQPYFGSYNNTNQQQQQQQQTNTLFNSDFHRPLAQQPQHAVASQQHHMMRQQQQVVSPLNLPMTTLDGSNNSSNFSKPPTQMANYSGSSEPGGLFFDPHFNFSAGRSVEVNQHHNQQMESSPQLTTLSAKDYNSSLNSAADGINNNRALVKSESYESDSGVSMELSPQRFNFAPSRDSPFLQNEIKTESITDLPTLSADFSRELKGVKHNHTYYGNGTKTRATKKPILSQSRESRDEKRARELGVPFTLDEIILTPVEEYNDMLARAQLTPEQQALIKDIRRRGKNKVAAQNCRKRKVETISNMEDDVDMLRSKKMELSKERNRLEMRASQMKHKYEALYKQVFSTLRNDRDEPLDPSKYRLEVVEGTLFILPGQQDGGNKPSSSSSNSNNQGMMGSHHHHQHSSSSSSPSSAMSNIDFNKVKLEMIDQ